MTVTGIGFLPCYSSVICSHLGSRSHSSVAMQGLPAGEFQLELSSTDGEEIRRTQSTELDSPDEELSTVAGSPDVVEISSSDSEVEIVSVKMVKMPPKFLTPSMELLKMKNEERYGHLYRIEDRQADWEAKLKRVRQEISSESPELREVRRKSFQKAVLGHDP